jgi:tetraacyldisaccharide 4'-kinase
MTYYLLSLLYGAITSVRNFFFDAGIFSPKKLPVPVISVGNITAGGAGKTPMVLLIGEILKSAGKPFGVLSRGYGRKSVVPFTLRSSKEVTAQQIGDEPKMIGEKTGCALGIGGNRVRIGRLLLLKTGPLPLILDDGFSHRWIRRDLDLLVIDGSNPWGKGMLPYGTRRETLGNVRRADAAVITRDTPDLDDTAIRRKLARLRFSKPLFTARRVPDGIVEPDGAVKLPADYFGTPFYLFSAIADGGRFERYVRSLGMDVRGTISYMDHFAFDATEMAQIRKNAGSALLLTTEKDFHRLGPLAAGIRYLRIRLEVDQAEPFKRLILDCV